jgi:AraC-like DNA-binding protein
MVHFIRAAALKGFAGLVQDAGLDPSALCQAAGVPPSALANPDERIRVDALALLLDLAARRTGLDDFALRMARNRRPSTWGAAGLLMARQKTIGAALQSIARYIAGHSEGVYVRSETYGEETAIWIDIDSSEDSIRFDPAQRNELVVGSAVQMMRRLLQRPWNPPGLGFTHSARGDLDRYRAYFGRIPLFDQDHLFLLATRADLDTPLLLYDPEADRLLRQLAEQQLPTDAHKPFSRAVSRLISQRLADGSLSAENVAAALDLDLRGLQRRLAAEGSSFSELLFDVRKNLAETFVDSSRRPLAEVADLLGFGSLSAFSQWYSRSHGQSAAERRSTLR